MFISEYHGIIVIRSLYHGTATVPSYRSNSARAINTLYNNNYVNLIINTIQFRALFTWVLKYFTKD